MYSCMSTGTGYKELSHLYVKNLIYRAGASCISMCRHLQIALNPVFPSVVESGAADCLGERGWVSLWFPRLASYLLETQVSCGDGIFLEMSRCGVLLGARELAICGDSITLWKLYWKRQEVCVCVCCGGGKESFGKETCGSSIQIHDFICFLPVLKVGLGIGFYQEVEMLHHSPHPEMQNQNLHFEQNFPGVHIHTTAWDALHEVTETCTLPYHCSSPMSDT